MYWLLEGGSVEAKDKFRSTFELPPVGYTGSLKGTVWDPDLVLAGYEQ